MCCFCASGEIPTAQLFVCGTNLSDKVLARESDVGKGHITQSLKNKRVQTYAIYNTRSYNLRKS